MCQDYQRLIAHNAVLFVVGFLSPTLTATWHLLTCVTKVGANFLAEFSFQNVRFNFFSSLVALFLFDFNSR